MQTLALAGAGAVLFLAVGVGMVAHELSHAAVLYFLGIQCDIDIGPAWVGTSRVDVSIYGSLAAVRPREITPETSAWAMRLSSVAPLILAVPFVTVVTGVVPDPLQADSLFLTAWTVGWLACAIPSPQDFAVFWHAERAVAEQTTMSAETVSPRADALLMPLVELPAMGLRDRLFGTLKRIWWTLYSPVTDHPERGGMTGDLDPDDWPDRGESEEQTADEWETPSGDDEDAAARRTESSDDGSEDGRKGE